MTDITSKLERIALVAEVANHYIDDMRVMPAAGVADTIREAMAQLESTMRDDRAYILEERDRTFALMLARVEKAEAERDRLRELVATQGRLLIQNSASPIRTSIIGNRLLAALNPAQEPKP